MTERAIQARLSAAELGVTDDLRGFELLARLARVTFVTGKGGVGKTTVAAALASLAGERGEAVLVELGDGAGGRRALGEAPVHHEVITAGGALEAAAARVFGSRWLAHLVLGNRPVQRFLAAAPGFHELAALDQVLSLAAARPRARIFVDLPATGHGFAWLRAAHQLAPALVSGPAFDLVRRVASAVADPAESSIVIVTLPEPLVMRETTELCASLRAGLGVAPVAVVVNRASPRIPRGAVAAAAVLAESGDSTLARAASAALVALEAHEAASREAAAALAALAERARIPHLTLGDASLSEPSSAALRRAS